MGHIKFDKGNGTKKGFNGFYLALAICLVAVGGVAVATFVSTMPKIRTETKNTENTTIATTSPTKPVNDVVTNIPDDRNQPEETTTAPTTKPTEADLFILPLTNDVIRDFSNNKPIFSATMNDWRVHNGVDFKGTANQPVKALTDGKIVSISEDALWGSIVVIDHGYGIKSRYCGVKVTKLKANDTVKVGDTIGTLSVIPCESTDSLHLHLEILVNDEYVNPIDAIGRDVNITTATTVAKAG